MLEYVFPPFPGDTIALFGVFLCASAGWRVSAVYTALNAGSVSGGMAAYGVGRLFRDPGRRPRLLRGPRTTAALATLAERYAEHGAMYVALNRFVPALRAFFFVAAGIAGLPPLSVAAYGLASALVWNAILLGVGYGLGASFEELETGLGVYGALMLAVALVAAIVISLRAFRRRASRRATVSETAARETGVPEAETPGTPVETPDRSRREGPADAQQRRPEPPGS